MAARSITDELHDYLQGARESLVWKLDGLGEYDIRRPMTPTGTNLLGLVKHSTGSHLLYFGDIFGRPYDHVARSPIGREGDPHADMWATPDESRGRSSRYRQAWAFADATISDLSSTTPGSCRVG